VIEREGISGTPDTYELTSVVLGSSALSNIPDMSIRIWRRNRTAQLLGFGFDEKDRLVGKAWVPKVGLKQDEFLTYLKRIATECELFAYNLLGKN
jgi:hypothetical protein